MITEKSYYVCFVGFKTAAGKDKWVKSEECISRRQADAQARLLTHFNPETQFGVLEVIENIIPIVKR